MGPARPSFRGFERFRVPDGEALVRARRGPGFEETEAHVRDLGMGGLSLVTSALHAPRSLSALVLELVLGGRPLVEVPVRAVHQRPAQVGDDAAQVLGLSFEHAREAFLQQVCCFLVDRFSQKADQPLALEPGRAFDRADGIERAERLLSYCIARGQGLVVLDLSGRPIGSFRPDEMCHGAVTGRLLNALPAALPARTTCYLAVETFTTFYLMRCEVLARARDRAELSIPTSVISSVSRRLARLPVDPERPITLEIAHPQIPGKRLTKVAEEVGLGGLRFELDPEEDLLARGSLLPSATLRLPEGEPLQCTGLVRHTFKDNAGRLHCGVELMSFAGAGRHTWAGEVLGRLNPEAREVTSSNVEEVWDLLDRTGYLAEKPAEIIGEMKEPFLETWSELLERGTEARAWLYCKDDQPIGTVGVSRIYSRTWLSHHLAMDMDAYPDKARKLIVVARLVPMTVLQWVAALSPDGYVLTYLDADIPFNQWAWFQFVREHAGGGEVVMQPLRVSELEVRDIEPMPEGAAWAREPAAEELSWVAEDLLRRDGPLFFDGLDYGTELDSSLASKEPREEADLLGRERRCFVAGLPSEPASGYCLCECARPGLNIFSLYDNARIVVKPGRSDEERALVARALLSRAADCHRAAGRRSFLCLSCDDENEVLGLPKAFSARAFRTLASTRFFPKWVRHLLELWLQR